MMSRLVLAAALLIVSGTSFAEGDLISAAQTPGRPPTDAARLAPAVPRLDWTDCGGGFQCANAKVPLDYARPGGRTIAVALIRRPAVDQANRIGSAFLNPGGPGYSGIEFIRTAPPPAFQALSRFDVIGFDPRGLGASRPAVVDCGDNPSYRSPIPRPATADKRTFLADTRAYLKNCHALNAEILPHLSSANVARDLDLLRAAVGDKRLTYLGASYGSVIGATYASLFPGRARALVLDSPIDVQGYYDNPIQQWQEHAGGHEHALDRFLTACAASQGRCGFGGADPRGAFDRLLARLDHTPVASSDPADPRKLDGDGVRKVLEDGLRSLRTRRSWPSLAAALSQAEAGDGKLLLSFIDDTVDEALDDIQTAVLAVDQQYRRSRVRGYFSLAHQSYDRYKHFWFLSGYWDLVRALWPAEDRDAFRGRIHNPATAAPILVIGMTHDPATPYAQAERLVADLGNARLLTFDADGHGAATSFDPCVVGAIVGYLNDGILPAEGAVCVQQGEPFPADATKS